MSFVVAACGVAQNESMAFAENLRRLMAQRGIRAAQLGPLLGVTPTTVRQWLEGKTNPVGHRLARIASALGVPPEALFAPPSGMAEKQGPIQTILTARARTSGENLFVVLLVIAPHSQELEPPTNPGRFKGRE